MEIIINGIVPKMSFGERTQIDKDLLQINTEHKDEHLDLTNSFKDLFPENLAFISIVDGMSTSVESDYSSVDHDTDDDTDDELFGTKSDNSSIASSVSNTHMEDVTKAISCIDFTDVDNTEGNKNKR